MRDGFAFSVVASCGKARRGRLTTPHGEIDTPAFMPVGTAGTVKGLTPKQVRHAGTQIVLANTYHLFLRPGDETVAQLGGLHRFMAWDGPILTDSGGYQVFSLSDLRKIDDDGVSFKSHIDGAALRLDAEASMRIQNNLGADIIMAFDECPPLPATPESLQTAVRRTIAWAERCKAAHRRPDQALYGIVQGGLDVVLRQECLASLTAAGFDGYALGGLSVGEKDEEMAAFLDAFTHQLPAGSPRYLMGVGTPQDIVRAVAAGVDQFDCVLPTRNGRKGYAFTSQGVLRLRNSRHRASREPLDPACACYCCANFSRGYLRHLFVAGEQLGGTLVSLHNVAFYQSLMARIRQTIADGSFDSWSAAFLAAAVPSAEEPE